MVLAVASFASFFTFATTLAEFPSADGVAHVLASFKVALERRVALVSWLGHVFYLDHQRRHACWHNYLLRRLLLLLDQSRNWLNAVDSHLGGRLLLLLNDWLVRGVFVDGEMWGHKLLHHYWLLRGHFNVDWSRLML